MASIEKRGGSYRIVFRYGGRKYTRSLRTRNEKAARASLARLEENVRRVELGLLTPPDDVEFAGFLLSDGRVPDQPKRNQAFSTLGELLDQYLDGISPASIEQTTLDGMRIHARHLKRVLGTRTHIDTISLSSLQDYVDKRAGERGIRKRRLSAATIRKELRTLSSAWTWGMDIEELSAPIPKKSLRFPKTRDKPPFQTREEIERKVARGGLSETEEAELWACLFLTLPEIDEILKFVKDRARQPFVYPMFVFAAHTGTRRSEMIRSESRAKPERH